MKINWKFALNITGVGLLLILGVIIVLPNFLNQPSIARQNVGKTFAGSMNRAQEVFFKENNRLATFGERRKLLGFEPAGYQTGNYLLKSVYQPNLQSVMNIGQAKRKGFKSYVGLVYVVKVGEEYITIKKMCESIKDLPLSKLPQIPQLPENAATSEDINCPSGFESWG
ncbi:MAG: type IV pilin-like G/H family protein [Cyanobacteriota bacterium]|nr:type IV pilin-like G/H family protein [Cyanobacteriota bacterium]